MKIVVLDENPLSISDTFAVNGRYFIKSKKQKLEEKRSVKYSLFDRSLWFLFFSLFFNSLACN